MAHVDADQAVLDLVQWDIQRGDSIELLRKIWKDKVVIRDCEDKWAVVVKYNAFCQRLVPKKKGV